MFRISCLKTRVSFWVTALASCFRLQTNAKSGASNPVSPSGKGASGTLEVHEFWRPCGDLMGTARVLNECLFVVVFFRGPPSFPRCVPLRPIKSQKGMPAILAQRVSHATFCRTCTIPCVLVFCFGVWFFCPDSTYFLGLDYFSGRQQLRTLFGQSRRRAKTSCKCISGPIHQRTYP